jgi:hypothetical protein
MRLINRSPARDSQTLAELRRSRAGIHTSRPSKSASRSRAATIDPMSERASRRRRRVRRFALTVEMVALTLVLSASNAHAETMVVALAASVTDVINNIRNWIMGILAGLATVFLTIGGVRYVVGGGDPGEVEKAKTAFKSAGWGYGLAALAPLVVEILKGIVGA